jgi:hypothetical protein
MSLQDLIVSNNNPWSNLNVNSLSIDSGINMNNSGLTNVSSINGNPVPPNVTLNPVNIIYQAGGPAPVIGSNIFNTWASVVAHAAQINIHSIINIYFDDSFVSPCPIDVSYDFQGRGVFKSAKSDIQYGPIVQINDGTLISNLLSIEGPYLTVLLQSITGPCLYFNTNSNIYFPYFYISHFSTLFASSDSVVPSIQINSSDLFFQVDDYSYVGSMNSNSILSLTNDSFFVITLTVAGGIENDIILGDATSSLLVLYDATVNQTFSYSGFLGSTSFEYLDLSQSISYDDAIIPAYGSTNVQGALDAIKGYLNNTLNTTNIVSTGTLSANNINSNTITNGGLISCGTLDSSVAINGTVLNLSAQFGAQITSNTAQTLVNNSPGLFISFDTVIFNNNISYTGNTNLTVIYGGVYMVMYEIGFSAGAGSRFAWMTKNDSGNYGASSSVPGVTDGCLLNGSSIIQMNSADSLQLQVNQDSGSNQTAGPITILGINYIARLTIWKIA